MINTIILEDNPYVVIEYQALLEQMEIDSSTVVKTISEFNSIVPELNNFDFAIVDLFLGTELSFSAIEIFEKNNIPVIIITGYPKEKFVERAVKLSVDSFLTKPVKEHELKFTLSKLATSIKLKKEKSFFYFKKRNKMVKLKWSDVNYFKSEGNYCIIKTNCEKYIIKKSLKQIKEESPKDIFIQVYRSYVVNGTKIDDIDFTLNVISLDGEQIPLSNFYKKEVKDILESSSIIRY